MIPRAFVKLAAVAALGLGLAALVPLTASCDGDVLPPKGQLMLVVTSNMAPPKDFDTLHVEVREDGATAPALDVDYALGGSQAVKLPATLGIVAGSWTKRYARSLPDDVAVCIRTDPDKGGVSLANAVALLRLAAQAPGFDSPSEGRTSTIECPVPPAASGHGASLR